MKKLELLCATALAMTFAAPAYAQTAPQDAEDTDLESNEIIVTATLRSENLQDVPLAVSAFSGETLEKAGVASLKNFEQVSASFNINSSQNESGGTTLRVRGVGTTGNNAGLESAVGIFLDGVYLSRPGVALSDLLDVQQLELLRGPQGTLFGRNTSAGAISIKTAKPNLNAFEGFANASYGNYDLISIQGGFSAPLADGQAGIRISGAYRNRDGFLRNAVGGESNDRNRYIIRGQFLYEPNSDFSVRLIADYSKSKELCCDAVIERESSYALLPVAVVGGQPITAFGANGLPNNGGAPISGPQTVKTLRTSNNFEFRDDSEQWGISAEINLALGDAQLTSITGYRDYEASSRQETDFVSVRVFSTGTGSSTATANSVRGVGNIKTFTQELRVAGSTANEKFDYLVGAYYADEKIDTRGTLTLGADHQAYISAPLTSIGIPGVNPARNIFAAGVSSEGSFANNRFIQNARNLSAFTNNTFHVSDRFKLNFGLRYSDDRKKGEFDQIAARSDACNATRGTAAAAAAAAAIPPAMRTPAQQQLAALAGAAPLAVALTCFPFASLANNGPGTPQEFRRVFKDNELVYTGKLLWEPIDNVNTYISFSHGYKSGGFNLDPTAAINGADPRFRSETVDAYELGIKAKLLDGRFLANLAIFKQDLSDFQVLEFTGVQFVTFNVASAKATGFELEMTARPSRNLVFNGAVTYSDAKYGKRCDRGVFNSTVSPLCGRDLTNAPKWTVVSGFDWTTDLGSSLKFNLNGSARLESDRRVSTQALLQVAAGTGNISLPNFPGGVTNNYILIPNGIQDSNIKVNLRAAIGDQDDAWTIEFWGNNIFDVRTKNVTFNLPLRGIGTLPGPFNAGGISVGRGSFVQEPRTYGVTARVKF